MFEEQQRKLEEERERLRQELFDQNLAHKVAGTRAICAFVVCDGDVRVIRKHLLRWRGN